MMAWRNKAVVVVSWWIQ